MAATPLEAQSRPQPPPLFTSRPNASDSPGTVPPGYVHFELGWTYARDRSQGLVNESLQFPLSAIRVGLTQRFEVQFVWSGYQRVESSFGGAESILDGYADGGLVFKSLLWEENGVLPAAGLDSGVRLPFGSDAFTGHRADPFAIFLFTHTLKEDAVYFSYNIGPSWSTSEIDGDRDTLSSLNYTVVFDFAAGNLGAFLEFFGSTGLSASGRAQNAIDTGFSYNFSNKLIVDFIIGRGLADEAADWFLGSGVTFRLPAD